MTRRYREDGERLVKMQAGHYVRRPQAHRPGLSRQEWKEIGYALAVWFLILLAVLYALPVILVGLS